MAKQRSVEELEKQLKAIEEASQKSGKTAAQEDAIKRITKELERQKSLYEEALNTNKEIDSTLQSIASSFGKSSKIYQKTQTRLGLVSSTVKSILADSEKWNGSSAKNRKLLETSAKAYKNINATVLKNVALLAEGRATEENIKDILDEQIAKHKEVLGSIDAKSKHSKKFKAELEGEIKAMEKLAAGAKKAESNITAIAREGEKFAGTMLGGGIDKTLKAFGKKDGLGGVIKKIQGSAGTAQAGGGMGGMLGNIMGGVSKFLGPIGLAVAGIMAAAEFFNSGGAAKMAMRLATLTGEDPMKASQAAFKQSQQYRDLMVEQNYGLPLKLKQQAESDYQGYSQSVGEDAAKYKESLITDEFEHRMSLESDAIQFRQQQAAAELDAQMAQQKTLFISGMGYAKQAIGISERALQAIGSSTQAVLDTVKDYGTSLGLALKDQIALSAAAQGLGARYGTSATEVFKMANTFRLMNKTSAKVGANLVTGIEALAKDNDMSPAQLYKEMADSQAEILKYSNLTAEQYARQSIELSKMNISMSSMMKASDSMVLNYKDSIKAEMSLSSMLGKNVNLSEVRAKLMSGDQPGGAAALKTALGGQDINAMNAFQKQALSQATGMGIEELMALTQSKGGKAKGNLEEKNALKTGKAIAQGALSQDIANAAAKLALDQKNRAEMLKFEQAKRLAMLFIEQKFRLNAIEREFKYREDREKLTAEQAIQTAQNDMFKEVAAEQIMSITSAYKDSFGAGKFDQTQVDKFKAQVGTQMDVLQNAMISGRISDAEMVDIAVKMQQAAMKGQTLDLNQFAGVQQYQKDSAASVKAESIANTKMIAAFENLERIENDKKKSGYEKSDVRKAVEAAYPNAYKQFKEAQRFKGIGSSAYIASLKKQKGGQAPVVGGTTATGGKAPSGVKVATKTATKTETKPAPAPLPPNTPKLTDEQAQTKLQVQMVKLLGVSAQFLAQIDENSAKPNTNINGKMVANSLLNAANKQYGIAGVSY
jgi:hypothetical protein